MMLMPKLRKKRTFRHCHEFEARAKHCKPEWKLPGFNKWRLSANQAKKIYIEHREGINVSLTKQQADIVRHKQFTAFFADFFNSKTDYKMNDSPHFKLSGFPES